MHIKINKNYLTYSDYKVKCCIGKRGINFKKKEGDLITPRGLFKILEVFYRKDRIKNLKCQIKKTIIRKNMGWCDDPESNKYNKLITYPFKFSSEKLYRSDNIYDIILVLSFNIRPVIKKKGSAIFIHVAEKNFSPTRGCVAIKKKVLLQLIKKINKRTVITIN